VLRLLGVACLFLVLLSSFVQVLHWHKEHVGSRDCATCVIGHSPSAPPPTHIAQVHSPAVTRVAATIVTFKPYLGLTDFTIRPPPSLSL
jgi:hypothetical protein